MNSLKVSIVIPIYNVEPYVADCVQSVIRQTYAGPLECILVDDCGSDKSMAIAEELVDHYEGPIKFKVLHHKHNRGLSASRNTGMDAAEGDYVYFMDSDDWMSDECIEELVGPLENYKYDMVVGDYLRLSEGIYLSSLGMTLPEGAYYSNGAIMDILCDRGINVVSWNKLVNLSFLRNNELRYADGFLHEDLLMAFETAMSIHSVFVKKTVTYYHRNRGGSIMTDISIGDNRIRAYMDVLRQMQQLILKKYQRVMGVYDFYMYWVRRLFGGVSEFVSLDNEDFVQTQTIGFLRVIPSVRSLSDKQDRLVFHKCKKTQTYRQYRYVTDEYCNTIRGRMMKKALSLLPMAS